MQPEFLGEWITEGRIIHVRTPGLDHCQPAVIVRHWGGGVINALVFRDGSNDREEDWLKPLDGALVVWRTSIVHQSQAGDDEHSWHFPERPPAGWPERIEEEVLA